MRGVEDEEGGESPAAGRRASLTCERLRRGRLVDALGRAEACEEQGLVDATLEDRHTELHALRDDVPALEAGLASKLGGREVISHRTDLLGLVLRRTPLIPAQPDVSMALVRSGSDHPEKRG